MAFDGLVTYTVVKELENNIINGKIDKIFEPNDNEIILGIYSNGIKYALSIVVSPSNYRICLTNTTKANPTFAPNFCMVLRKYLLNSKIKNIYTLSLERLVIIEFEGRDKTGEFGTKKLIIELMGKHSNIILADEKDIIIDSLKHFSIESNSYRNILPNYKYLLPISNKLDFNQIKTSDEFYNVTLQYISENNISNSTLADIISNTYTGISKSSISYIINQLSIENIFNKNNIYKIYNYLYRLLNNTSYAIVNAINDNDYSISLSELEKEDLLQVNYFLDEYYNKKESSENFISYRNNLSKLILNYMKKLNNKLFNINNKLKECKNTDLYRLYGELITNNLYRIDNKHTDKIEIENYYDNNNLITIPLDKSISPAQNAKRYFKKYNKLKNARQIVETQKQEVESEIDYLESIIYSFQEATTLSEIDVVYNEFSEIFADKKLPTNKKNKKMKKATKKDNNSILKIGEPIKYVIDGFTVLVGKNNKQNDYITKQANPEDIWFHTKDIHGSHVILKTNNKQPLQETINKCASLAAFHSKAVNSSNVPVDYTYIKYVKKPSKSKPGMVIYTNNKNVIVKPTNTFDQIL